MLLQEEEEGEVVWGETGVKKRRSLRWWRRRSRRGEHRHACMLLYKTKQVKVVLSALVVINNYSFSSINRV